MMMVMQCGMLQVAATVVAARVDWRFTAPVVEVRLTLYVAAVGATRLSRDGQ